MMTILYQDDIVELVSQKGNWILKRELGFSPVQLLVAAIAGCGTYVYASILKKSNIEHEFIKVEFDYTQNQEATARPLQTVTINFYLKVDLDFQARALKSKSLINKHCPVIQSLDPKVKVEENIIFV